MSTISSLEVEFCLGWGLAEWRVKMPCFELGCTLPFFFESRVFLNQLGSPVSTNNTSWVLRYTWLGRRESLNSPCLVWTWLFYSTLTLQNDLFIFAVKKKITFLLYFNLTPKSLHPCMWLSDSINLTGCVYCNIHISGCLTPECNSNLLPIHLWWFSLQIKHELSAYLILKSYIGSNCLQKSLSFVPLNNNNCICI